MWDRNQMAARAAQELQDGWYVNLGNDLQFYRPAGYVRPCTYVTHHLDGFASWFG